jgi:hypothetical protein
LRSFQFFAQESNQGKGLQKAVNVVNWELRRIESCQETLRKRRMHTGVCLNFNETSCCCCCCAEQLIQSCVFARRVFLWRGGDGGKESAETAAHTLLNEFRSSALNPIEYVVGVDIVTETRCAPRLQLNEALVRSLARQQQQPWVALRLRRAHCNYFCVPTIARVVHLIKPTKT